MRPILTGPTLARIFCTASCALLLHGPAVAHQQPTTLATLDVGTDQVAMTLHLPLPELQLAFGHDLAENPRLLGAWGPPLRAYLMEHIRSQSPDGRPWRVTISGMSLAEANQQWTWS